MYEYYGIITSVYDGDTLTADVDLGFKMCAKKIKLRLLGVDTPEIRTKDSEEKELAIIARDRVRDICLNKQVVIKTSKKGKYGRWLSSIQIDGKDLAGILISEGLAEKYEP